METLETKIRKSEVLLEREREMRHALEAYRESLVQVQYFNKKGDAKQSAWFLSHADHFIGKYSKIVNELITT
jgi:hypothetical protein